MMHVVRLDFTLCDKKLNQEEHATRLQTNQVIWTRANALRCENA